jgi:hypothetical protein
MKFRKKPVVIEAAQWFKNGDHPLDYTEKHDGRQTPVCPGDWIITGIKGERYPCKPDIFEATYEPAEEQT